MSAKEIIVLIMRLFPSILGAVLLAAVLVLAVFDFTHVPLSYIGMFLMIAVLLALSLFIFYSKKALSKKQILIRYAIQFTFTLAVSVTVAASMWEFFQYWFLVAIVPLQMMGYSFIIWLSEIGQKELSNQLNEGLEKYQKGR